MTLGMVPPVPEPNSQTAMQVAIIKQALQSASRMADQINVMADTRAIQWIENTVAPEFMHWCVGRNSVEKIEAYEENGQMAPIVWLAVYRNGVIAVRVPAQNFVIAYSK